MTDAASEQEPLLNDPRPLVPNGLYYHFGRTRLAIDAEYLVDLDTPDSVKHAATIGATSPLAMPGSEEWVNRMMVLRRSLISGQDSLRHEVNRWEQRYEDLGHALLAKADERDWCAEYDDFAEEWGLPTRNRTYEVTITVKVAGRSEEQAVDEVKSRVDLDPYDDGAIVTVPRFDVEEA